MIAVMVLAVLVQARPAAVGDTVWVTTRVALPAKLILRPQAWDLGDLAQVLGPPEVDYEGDSATVRYPVAFWYPGDHSVSVPGPIVVSPQGRSDTLAARVVAVRILSVLPAGADKKSLAPRGAAPLVQQATRSWLPLGFLLALVGATAAVVTLLRRRSMRRRRSQALTPVPVPEPDLPAVLEGWARAGETRTALDGWAHLIERELEARKDSDRAAATPLLDAMALAGFRRDEATGEIERLMTLAKRWLDRKAA